MDKMLVQTRQRFDSAQTAGPFTERAAPLTAAKPPQIASNVVMTSFELFHGARSPARAEKDNQVDIYNQGVADGEGRAAQLHSRTVKAMEKSLSALQSHYSQSLKDIEQAHANALLTVLQDALPALVRQSFFQDVSDMITTLENSRADTDIQVCCAPEDVEPLNQLFQTHSNPSQFKISPAPTGQNEIKFEWANGGAEIDYGQTAKAALRSLVSHFDTYASAPNERAPTSPDENRKPQL